MGVALPRALPSRREAEKRFVPSVERASRLPMKRANPRRLLLGLAASFGVLTVVSFLLLASADQENKISAAVVHTRDVLDKIDELLTALNNAETERRGYGISGQESYQRAFAEQAAQAYQSLGQLRELTKDNPPQTEACARLGPLIRQVLVISTNSLQARQAGPLSTPAQAAVMEQVRQSTEPIRQITAQMAARESALLKQRQQVQDKSVKDTQGFAVLLALCGLALFAALFALFWRADGQRRRAEQDLEKTNQALEGRVRQRTEELVQ